MNAGQFVNQHSYLIFGLAVLATLAVILLVRRARRAWLVWGGLVVLLAAAWFVLQIKPTPIRSENMKTLFNQAKVFLQDEEGASAVEYGLLVAGIAVAVMAAMPRT